MVQREVETNSLVRNVSCCYKALDSPCRCGKLQIQPQKSPVECYYLVCRPLNISCLSVISNFSIDSPFCIILILLILILRTESDNLSFQISLIIAGVYSGRLPLSFAAPVSNQTDVDSSIVPPWVADPSGRGTWRIIYSCVFTLVLCVYTAIHLNILAKKTQNLPSYSGRLNGF